MALNPIKGTYRSLKVSGTGIKTPPTSRVVPSANVTRTLPVPRFTEPGASCIPSDALRPGAIAAEAADALALHRPGASRAPTVTILVQEETHPLGAKNKLAR